MKKKKLISILWMTFMLLVSTVFGLEVPSVTFNSDNQSILITGKTKPLADVNIVVSKEGKRYFLDTIEASLEGDYTFKSQLPKDKVFDVIVSSGDEVVHFELETKEGNHQVVDKKELIGLIQEARQKEPAKYTQESWANLEKALKVATTIEQNMKATQEEVHQGAQQLREAIQGLKEKGPNPNPNPTTKYVTLSVDKLTINKGYVIEPMQVPFTSGETVWDVLKRELDQRHIDYDYTFTSEYNSVYVESIDGDGEFDHGKDSGWMYHVNGHYPGYGSSLYTLKEGDSIKWRYTTKLGEDLDGNAAMGGGGGGGARPEGTLEVPNEKAPTIHVPKVDKKVFHINLTEKLDQVESVKVVIPEMDSKVYLNVATNQNPLPMTQVTRTPFTLEIDKATRLVSGPTQIGLFNKESTNRLKQAQDVTYYKITDKDEEIVFSQPIRIKITKGSPLKLAWAIGEEIIEIPLYETEQAAKESMSKKKANYYGYKQGEDVIISTKTLSSLVTYKENQSISYKDTQSISPWAKEAVAFATQKGIVSGDEGYFRPQEAVTRAAFTKMLLHTLYGEEISASKDAPFKDVEEEKWFKEYVDMAYEKGIIEGDGQCFRPNETINREEMAVMIVRALELDKQDKALEVKDLGSISKWAQEEVATAYQYGLVSGIDDAFKPQETATREMAIVVAIRAYKMQDTP